MNIPVNKIVEFLPWDSEFFGVRIARFSVHHISLAEMRSALRWCCTNKIRCLYFHAETNDSTTIRIAEDNHFQLVDIRVAMEMKMRSPTPIMKDNAIRHATRKDLPILRDLFAGISSCSRFHFDTRFPPDVAERLYRCWIERSIEGYATCVFVLEDNNTILGCITGHLNAIDKSAKVGLLAVSNSARLKGVGSRLLQAFCCFAAEQKYTTYQVVTQGRNIAAQRLYARNKFLIKSVLLTYHKWMDK